MPYDPYASTQTSSEGSFRLLWLGGAMSLIALASQLIAWAGAGALTIAAAIYAVALLNWKHSDGYLRALLADGARWALTLGCLWLIVLALLILFGGDVAGGTHYHHGEADFAIAAQLGDAMTALLASLGAFYGGAAFAHWRK